VNGEFAIWQQIFFFVVAHAHTNQVLFIGLVRFRINVAFFPLLFFSSGSTVVICQSKVYHIQLIIMLNPLSIMMYDISIPHFMYFKCDKPEASFHFC